MPMLTLEDSQVRDAFITEKSLMKPSVDSTPPPSVGGWRPSAPEEDQFEVWLESAKQVVSVAQARAAAVPSPTNLIRLAQAQYVAGDSPEAAESAISAMTDAVGLVESGQCDVNELALVFGSGATLLSQLDRQDDALRLMERVGPSPSLELTYASLLIEADRLVDALQVLISTEDALADALRGYIYAVQGQTQRAVHFLRQSLRRNPTDAETSINLATAYWKLGSRKKAVASALRATRLEPSRQDISIAYMELLIENNQPDLASAEAKRLRKAGVVECARLLLIECQAALAKGERKTALTLMRRARTAAVAEGDKRLVAEVDANLRVFEASEAGKERADLWRIARRCVTESPHNVAALRQFAAYSYRRHHAGALRNAIAAAGALTTSTRLQVEEKLAFISCDFGLALDLARQAVEENSMNAEACAQALLLEGWHLGTWESAAKKANRWVARVPLNDILVNNAAYVMALGGMPHAALTVLDQHLHGDDDYVPIATRGLAYLAAGDLDTGMRWYRRAAERADSLGEGDMRGLMALHQAAGLRTLGIVDVTDETFLAATSLPDTGLPADWEDQPGFVMIQRGCEREGWPWPPTVMA
ncbi:tetratricopeptide repeat protein [Jiangella gansuensis]|uniref:tetratricopeptide repeat protein n=1 Tax=Jiangella gansuensis TaxID=281473 RepID=UPI00047D00DE|nr:tetratricopeptide repeat protein [Jiangella gansuensis]